MQKTYIIEQSKKLYIECKIQEYNDIIEKRMKMFEETENKKEKTNYVKILKDKTIFKINNKKTIVSGKLKHTDLYQLINNSLSNLINDSKNLYIHSVVLEYKGKGILLLGDFNSGKTFLSLESRKKGFDILSADQSWLKKIGEDVFLYRGSKYLAINNNFEIINNNKVLKIYSIIILKGSCGNKTRIINEENEYRNLKNLSKYATWSINNVLMTDDIDLTLNKVVIKKFLKDINLKVFYVFGKVNDIIKFMKGILK